MNNESSVLTSQAKQPRRIFRLVRNGFAGIGMLTVALILVGIVLDYNRIDETSGGYEYPHTGWTGTPINWSETFTTDEGMYGDGYVLDTYINCETGMVEFSFLGLFRAEWREFSDRAKVVHQPQIACQERGFETDAWDSITIPE